MLPVREPLERKLLPIFYSCSCGDYIQNPVPDWQKSHGAPRIMPMNPKKTRNFIRVGTATRLIRYRTGSVASQADLLHTYWKKKKIRRNRYKPKKKAPPPREPKPRKLLDFNIFQANVSGINKKREHLKSLMDKKNVHVALLQETQHWS